MLHWNPYDLGAGTQENIQGSNKNFMYEMIMTKYFGNMEIMM